MCENVLLVCLGTSALVNFYLLVLLVWTIRLVRQTQQRRDRVYAENLLMRR